MEPEDYKGKHRRNGKNILREEEENIRNHLADGLGKEERERERQRNGEMVRMDRARKQRSREV